MLRARSLDSGAGVGRRPKANRAITTTPRAMSSPETIGRAAAPSRFDRTDAPTKPPRAPGTPRRATSRHDTLPNLQWATPETKVVPTSDKWTVADATAGAVPPASSAEVAVTP